MVVPGKFQTNFFVGDRDCAYLIQKRGPIKNRHVCGGFREIIEQNLV